MKPRSLACILLLAAAGPALAQEPAPLNPQRRQRLEMIEKVQAAQREAWNAFRAGADKDGVRFACGAPPTQRQIVLYRSYAFVAGEAGELSTDGYRYGLAEGALTWTDRAGARWTLKRDGWLLSEEASAAQGKAPEPCRKIRGDEAEITAAPPAFPQIR